MKVVILGTGDMTKILRFTKVSESELKKLVDAVGKLIAEKGHELVIIPDRGIPTEVAKAYKRNKGRKVYGIIPVKDKKFGIKHLEPYLNLVDKKIEVEHWYDADGEIAASGEICIVIGLSPGIVREIAVLKYHYRYHNSKTKVFWFRNTISQEMPKEVEEEIPITYVNSVEELEKYL